MNLVSCSVIVNCTDEGGWWHGIDAIDMGDKYRVVLRWADSTEFPDQGAIPGFYQDVPKHLFQREIDPTQGEILRCKAQLFSDKTFADTFGRISP